MITEIILGLGALGIGFLYIWLKKIRKKEFETYLKSEDYRLGLMKAEKWVINGVDIPKKIDYKKSWENFDKTRIWNYEFAQMVVLEKRNG